jgi:hypothetical protein
MIIGNLGEGINGFLRLRINQPAIAIKSTYSFPIVDGEVSIEVPPNPANTVYLVDVAVNENDYFRSTEAWIIPRNIEGITLDSIRGVSEYSIAGYRQEIARLKQEIESLQGAIADIKSERNRFFKVATDRRERDQILGRQDPNLLRENGFLKSENTALFLSLEILRSRTEPDAELEIERMSQVD